MKVRIKFSKQGVMRFIGHLDVMRYFQKALRRAELPIKYSEGFSPHMIMSFASPLGVGLTSDAEYMDIELTETVSTADAVKRLNEVMVDGMEVLDMREIESGKAGKAMSIVAAADYKVSFREGMRPEGDFAKGVADLLAADEILVEKENKKGQIKSVNIRGLIYDLKAEEDGTFFMRLSQGSAANLKPEAVMSALLKQMNVTAADYSMHTNRIDVYADLRKDENAAHDFVSLGELGQVIA